MTTIKDSQKDEQEQNMNRTISEKFVHHFEAQCHPQYIIDNNGDIFITQRFDGLPPTFKLEKNLSERHIMILMRKFGIKGGFKIAQNILEELQSIALEKGIHKKVNIRYGKKEDSIYIDLANPDYKGYIEINPNDLQFNQVDSTPVPFWTSPTLRPLPIPEHITRKDFFEMWNSFFIFEEEYGGELLLAFIIKCILVESGTCPFLILEGPQGSGKSTMTKMIKMLIDPTHPLLFSPPDKEETIAIVASLIHLPSFDNISYLGYNIADAFCRLSTGAGLAKRKLFSNGDLSTFDIQRPVIFNGIEDLSSRPDFLDRAITLHLKPFGGDRELESDTFFWDKFSNSHSKLLGGIYALTSEVLRVLPEITTSNLPRLSDYVRIGLALDIVLNRDNNHFSNIFNQHQQAKVFNLFSNNEFCLRLKEVLERYQGEIQDTPTMILSKLTSSERFRSITNMPKNISQFRGALKRHRSVLEANNIHFMDLPRTASQRTMRIWIEGYIDHLEDDEDIL